MKKVYIVPVAILVILLAVVAVFIYERAHASLYMEDLGSADVPAPAQTDGATAPETAPGARPEAAPSARPEAAPGTRPEAAPSARPEAAPPVPVPGDTPAQTQTAIAEEKNDMGYRQISMADAKKIFDENPGGDYVILDVRRPDEFKDGHIPGAINVANETIGTEKIDELPDLDATIYVYCRSGNRSRQASEKLASIGYSDIIEFGGIMNWPGKIEK